MCFDRLTSDPEPCLIIIDYCLIAFTELYSIMIRPKMLHYRSVDLHSTMATFFMLQMHRMMTGGRHDVSTLMVMMKRLKELFQANDGKADIRFRSGNIDKFQS